MHPRTSPRLFVGAFLIVAALLPTAATPVAAAGATVPAGFADETIWAGLDHPMAIAFAPDGKVFVAEKRGTINVFDSLTDTTPTSSRTSAPTSTTTGIAA